jgi:hypothetical protein
MVSKKILWLMASVAIAAFGRNTPKLVPVPSDPLEMATGQIQVVDSPADRERILELLARARNSYALRSSNLGYDLKVTFTVNSGGETQYDGTWEMEDISVPTLGLRWTAKAAAGYTTTQISTTGVFYAEGTSSTIPLRLHEARAALFGPIPSAANVNRAYIRTSTATFHGAPVTCVLLSGPGGAKNATPTRSWEETEECIDPQSGLLQMQSQVPGRYYAYDYTNALPLGAYVMPHKITVTEAGKTVSEISVTSLKELTTADPSLFHPTEAMEAAGEAVAMVGAQKISRESGKIPANATIRPVCIFGLVTATGRLVEAHSLQPTDPNSPTALEAVEKMNFAQPAKPGARPQQHFVFVVEGFVAGQ